MSSATGEGTLIEAMLSDCRPGGDADAALVLADRLLERGEIELAASALDRAFGLRPHDPAIAKQRAAVLDDLQLDEHGLRWRYVPAGAFLMGSEVGDPDERPVHAARIEAGFWLTDAALSWADYCAARGWQPPPEGARGGDGDELADWMIFSGDKIRLQYCETATRGAMDWHAHAGMEEHFGSVDRGEDASPVSYDQKPMVAVTAEMAEAAARSLGQRAPSGVAYRLPAEVEWERAARGGLIGAPYAWGSEAPSSARCDFERFDAFALRPRRTLPPNGYGLYGMCGGVWEWTADGYDALAYRAAAGFEVSLSTAEEQGAAALRVLRGGSWSDCAAACTVSFRMARPPGDLSANAGLRLLRCRARPD